MAAFSLLLLVVAVFLFPTQPFATQLEYQLTEELSVNTMVGNIKTDFSMRSNYSDITLSSFRYRFDTPSDYFRIEPVTGEIRIRSIIDHDVICRPFEDRCVISCDVTIEASGRFYDIVPVVYVIVDVNDNSPEFQLRRKRLEVSELTPVGTMFSLPTADDSDGEEFGVRGYRMHGEQDTFELIFFSHSDELKLRLKRTLDREQVAGYSMRIVAEDGGSPPRTAELDLEIVVKDENDNPPRLPNENYEATLEENLPFGTRILQVNADDPDEGDNGNLTFTFNDETERSHGDVFRIDPDGWIYVTGVIDYERNKNLVLTIIVCDRGVMPLTAYAKVAIYISDVNDNDPVIAVSNIENRRAAEVHENQPVGALVAHISVTDADGGENGKVVCDIDNSRFRLTKIADGHTDYTLVSADTFDREERSVEALVMTCRDRGQTPRTSSLPINVWIVDENDNSPKFVDNKIQVRIRENNSPGDRIAVFTVSDLDEGKNSLVTFSIEAVGSSPMNTVFVDSQGVVSANMVFDYEERQQYTFRVVARDRGIPPRSNHAILEIQIEDVNDERPTFEAASYIFRTRENLPPGTLVGKVRAVDGDHSADFRHVYYSFVGGHSYLSVDPVRGEILIAKVLDRESQSSVTGKIRASNDLDPRSTSTMYSEVEVVVYVEDENDNAPVITFPNLLNNSLTLRSDLQPRDRVCRIEAFDRDEGINSALTFSINGTGDLAKYFDVEASTGWIIIASEHEERIFSELGEVVLTVRVTDRGRPPRSSSETLVLVVKEWEEAEVEMHSVNVFQSSFILIAVGVSCGVLAIVVVLVLTILCFRIHRFQVKNRHSYNCRLEASKASSNCSLNKFTNRLGDNSDHTQDGEYRCREMKGGAGRKGVRFNLVQENGISISSPITDCRLSCPFPEECAFHRNDVVQSSNGSSPSSSYSLQEEPLYTFGADDECLAVNGGHHLPRPCHEPLARFQRQVQPPLTTGPRLPPRTLRKVDIPTIDQIVSNRIKSNQGGRPTDWSSSPNSYAFQGRPSSVPDHWSNGSLQDSGQGPSDGEDSGAFYPGSQEPFFPAESHV